MAEYPQQGEVWRASFQEGWERPAIVVSRNELNRGRLVLVVPCTSSQVDDLISLDDVISAILQNGELIEEHASDLRCLIHCISKRRHIHAVFDYHDFSKGLSHFIEIVTIYKPDPSLWINYRRRKK